MPMLLKVLLLCTVASLVAGAEEPIGEWRDVQTLHLATGTIRVGMRIKAFNLATGREILGMVRPSKLPNYTYSSQLDPNLLPYGRWRWLVVGKTDFRVQFQDVQGAKFWDGEVVRRIQVWHGPVHPNPSGTLHSMY